MFICWRMSGVCDWQLVPWDCRGGKSCGTFHSGQILNLLLCLWISQLCILVDPLHSQLVVSDNDVFTILCILCRHSYMFSLAYLTDSHCVLWYVSEKGTTWWWKNWNYADWSCYNKEVWVALGICHYLLRKWRWSINTVQFQWNCHMLVVQLCCHFHQQNSIAVFW